MLAVITIPLWLDRAMPYLIAYGQVAARTAEHWSDVLKKLIHMT
jgi:hypothetical protein